MAVTFHTVTGNVFDILGDVDPARTKVVLETNLPAGVVMLDEATNRVLAGGRVLPRTTTPGEFTFTVPATDSVDVNPPGVQYRVRITFPDPTMPGGLDEVVVGWLDILGAGPSLFTDLASTSYVPVNFMSDAIAQLQTYLDQGGDLLAQQSLIAGITTADSAISALVNGLSSLTAQALADASNNAANPFGLAIAADSTADRGRANHTGTQLASTISDIAETIRDTMGVALVGGTNITITPNDPGDTITITAASGGAPLAAVYYNPSTGGSFTTTSVTPVDVNAANLSATFIAPTSGAVRVRLEAYADPGGGAYNWSLRENTTDVLGSNRIVMGTSAIFMRHETVIRLTGLTPGASYTYKWAHRVASGTGLIYFGYTGSEFAGLSDYGPAIMEVFAA